MLSHFVLALFGLAVLIIGGDLLVRGMVALANALRAPRLLVSAVIIAFGAAAPELFTAATSVLKHQPGIAIGAIVGSTIANALLVLGLPALLYPMSARAPGLRRHAAALLFAMAAFAAIAYAGGVLDRMTGSALLAGIILYVLFVVLMEVKTKTPEPVLDEVAEYSAEGKTGEGLLFAIVGLIALPLGARIAIDNGAAIAADYGVRTEAIGITLIAIGAALPELATIVVAALHKKSDVAIGGVVGSSIFNLLAVAGVAGIAGTATFSPASLRFEIPVMIAAVLALSVFIFTRRDIGRFSGAAFLAAYGVFLAVILINSRQP